MTAYLHIDGKKAGCLNMSEGEVGLMKQFVGENVEIDGQRLKVYDVQLRLKTKGGTSFVAIIHTTSEG